MAINYNGKGEKMKIQFTAYSAGESRNFWIYKTHGGSKATKSGDPIATIYVPKKDMIDCAREINLTAEWTPETDDDK